MLFVVIAHDIESSFCLPSPLPSRHPLLASSPPRPSSHTFRHTGFSARLENDTILQEDRTLVKTASFVEQGYITSRVSRYRCPRFTVHFDLDFERDYGYGRKTMRRLPSKKKITKRRKSFSFSPFFFFFSLFSLRSKGEFALSANRQRRSWLHTPAVVTQRAA